MFETHDSAEEYIPSEIGLDGLHAWNSVHTRLHMPWLQVVFASRGTEGFVHSQISLLIYNEQLLELDRRADIKILEVYLVSPCHVNNGKGWEMAPLKEIWTGIEPGTEGRQETEIFVLENGDRYCYSPLSTEEDDLQDKRCIFSI